MFFGILSSAMIFVVYVIYFASVRRGDATPNPSTWTVWLVVNVLNSATYLALMEDVWKGLITIVVSVLVFGLFAYALFQAKFSRIGWVEIVSFGVAAGAGIFWQLSGDPRVANLALQAVFAASYVPTLMGLAKGTGREHPLPWALATIAFVFASLGVVSEKWDGDWIKLAYPAMNGILGNASVAFLAFIKRSAMK